MLDGKEDEYEHQKTKIEERVLFYRSLFQIFIGLRTILHAEFYTKQLQKEVEFLPESGLNRGLSGPAPPSCFQRSVITSAELVQRLDGARQYLYLHLLFNECLKVSESEHTQANISALADYSAPRVRHLCCFSDSERRQNAFGAEICGRSEPAGGLGTELV